MIMDIIVFDQDSLSCKQYSTCKNQYGPLYILEGSFCFHAFDPLNSIQRCNKFRCYYSCKIFKRSHLRSLFSVILPESTDYFSNSLIQGSCIKLWKPQKQYIKLSPMQKKESMAGSAFVLNVPEIQTESQLCVELKLTPCSGCKLTCFHNCKKQDYFINHKKRC